jgi:hypothetical protein
MNIAVIRRMRLGLVLLGALVALSLASINGASPAQASTSTYCTQWLGGWGNCKGAERTFYQLYGWGDQGRACVGSWGSPVSCSSGPGAGVYSATYPNIKWFPFITNGTAQNNFVHGIALQP